MKGVKNLSSVTLAMYASYAAALLFLAHFSMSLLPPERLLPNLIAVCAHLVTFLVIAGFRGPQWTRAAGYGWLVISLYADNMALNGVAPQIFLPFRQGGYISAAVWIAVSSWQAGGMTRIAGLFLVFDLVLYSLIPHAPLWVLSPTFALLPLWFLMVGFLLAKERKQHVLLRREEAAL
ncbi:hypothetical protein KSC_043270 [Ktedonobacter sp. SOSP1-52]|uniref:hypothetical protein n=1 Tax=Ktedonobacter sp. SOSP1-52 TaxID=2778366 RepID=UPI0019154C48|nr:hypothetical protein [Ktedonobacter sp. SOSP1-52]GHO65435.1 hypothetical protein KSC_043270 [Ktedonobacter sp. SOSP1-52]